ncbi:MAG: four helix bundle suffix domain-containing protein [Verrucomicrobia bacterium]|nr:four helix bundle suffix domain-containing protein [Verrucomicrobiota bacterium]
MADSVLDVPAEVVFEDLKSFQVAQLVYDVSVACSLLNRQLAAQEKAFLEQGGFTERLYRMRQQRRNRS